MLIQEEYLAPNSSKINSNFFSSVARFLATDGEFQVTDYEKIIIRTYGFHVTDYSNLVSYYERCECDACTSVRFEKRLLEEKNS